MLYWNIYSGGVSHFQTAERTLLTRSSRFTCSLNLLENIALYQLHGKIERLNPLELSHIYRKCLETGGKTWQVTGQVICLSLSSGPIRFFTSIWAIYLQPKVTLVTPLWWCATFFDLTLAKKSRSKTETNYLPRKPSVLSISFGIFEGSCFPVCSSSWLN